MLIPCTFAYRWEFVIFHRMEVRGVQREMKGGRELGTHGRRQEAQSAKWRRGYKLHCEGMPVDLSHEKDSYNEKRKVWTKIKIQILSLHPSLPPPGRKAGIWCRLGKLSLCIEDHCVLCCVCFPIILSIWQAALANLLQYCYSCVQPWKNTKRNLLSNSKSL